MSGFSTAATWIAATSYFVAATLFLLGLQRMASPLTARSGIRWAGLGMVIATVATFLLPGLHNMALIVTALAIGTMLAWVSGKKVAITDMPQMVALYNGMGGGSAAAIGAVELLRFSAEGRPPSTITLVLGVVGALIGAVSLSGSVIAWAKLDGRMDKRYTFPGQQLFNAAVAIAAVVLGGIVIHSLGVPAIIAFFIAALALGVLMTLPIGGADMPVVISLYNALTGLAVAFEGYVLDNQALIIAGTMVGAAGTLLTQLMAKAMNRPIRGVLFSNFGGGAGNRRFAKAHRSRRRRRDDGLCRARGDRSRLRPRRRAGPAQSVGAGTETDRSRGQGEVRHSPGRGPHAWPHERAARGSRRALRPDRRHG